MDYSLALIEGLTLLSDALDDPTVDLQAVLSVLTDDLSAAVPAYLGPTVTLHVQDHEAVFTNMDAGDTGDVRASLMLPLLPLGASATTGSVARYSGSGGHSSIWPTMHGGSSISTATVFDDDLPPTAGDSGCMLGLTALSDFNQAVGRLVEDGYAPRDADNELRRRAHRDGHGIPDTVRGVLRTLRGRRI